MKWIKPEKCLPVETEILVAYCLEEDVHIQVVLTDSFGVFVVIYDGMPKILGVKDVLYWAEIAPLPEE